MKILISLSVSTFHFYFFTFFGGETKKIILFLTLIVERICERNKSSLASQGRPHHCCNIWRFYMRNFNIFGGKFIQVLFFESIFMVMIWFLFYSCDFLYWFSADLLILGLFDAVRRFRRIFLGIFKGFVF